MKNPNKHGEWRRYGGGKLINLHDYPEALKLDAAGASTKEIKAAILAQDEAAAAALAAAEAGAPSTMPDAVLASYMADPPIGVPPAVAEEVAPVVVEPPTDEAPRRNRR